MLKITYQKDHKKYQAKPEDDGRLKNQLARRESQKTASVAEFLEDCLKYTVAPFTINPKATGGLSIDQWSGQQVIMLDIDNTAPGTKERISDKKYIPIEEIRGICAELHLEPAMIYVTLSSQTDWHRYRIVFIADEFIDKAQEQEAIMDNLHGLFEEKTGQSPDQQCKERSRIFYPGKSCYYRNDDARMKVEPLKKRGHKEAVSEKRPEKTSLKKHSGETRSIVDLIKKGDVEGLRIKLKEKGLLPLQYRGSEGKMCSVEDGREGLALQVGGSTLLQGIFFISSNVDHLTQQGSIPVIATSYTDILKFTWSIPLTTFFGVSSSCHCLVHDDSKPSASIQEYPSDEGYVYRYFCHSSNCVLKRQSENGTYTATILDLIGHLQGNKPWQALSFLEEVLGVTFFTEKQYETMINLKAFRHSLQDDLQRIKETYPDLFSMMNHHFSKYVAILDHAIQILKRSYLAEDSAFMFSLSTRQYQDQLKCNQTPGAENIGTLNKRIQLFSWLGLLKIKQDSDIDSRKLIEAKKHSPAGSKKRTGFYQLPVFDEELLRQADQAARVMKHKKITKSIISRDFLIASFGHEIAAAYYVQSVDEKLKPHKEKLYEKIREEISSRLQNQHYVHKAEVLKAVRGYDSSLKEKAYQECLPGIMLDQKLRCERVNKKNRKLYSIPEKIESNSHILTHDKVAPTKYLS